MLTGAANAVKSCVDGGLALNPTCGWALDGSGNKIYNSQGFCCACTLGQVAGSTFGTGSVTGIAQLTLILLTSWTRNGRVSIMQALLLCNSWADGTSAGHDSQSNSHTWNVHVLQPAGPISTAI